MADTNQGIATEKLMDEEVRQEAEHRAKIGKVTLEVEAIFLREGLTMGDFLEILGMFTSRANSVFEKTRMLEIKQSYERYN